MNRSSIVLHLFELVQGAMNRSRSMNQLWRHDRSWRDRRWSTLS